MAATDKNFGAPDPGEEKRKHNDDKEGINGSNLGIGAQGQGVISPGVQGTGGSSSQGRDVVPMQHKKKTGENTVNPTPGDPESPENRKSKGGERDALL